MEEEIINKAKEMLESADTGTDACKYYNDGFMDGVKYAINALRQSPVSVSCNGEGMSRAWSEDYHHKVDEINENELIYHKDYIRTDKWFAWRPVKTTNAGWVWWKIVKRTIDERPEVYLGLLPEYSYYL